MLNSIDYSIIILYFYRDGSGRLYINADGYFKGGLLSRGKKIELHDVLWVHGGHCSGRSSNYRKYQTRV